MTMLVRTPTLNVRQAGTLRILLRLQQAQLLQDAIQKNIDGQTVDPVTLTEEIFTINDMFENYYTFIAAIITRAKESSDGRCEFVLTEAQWGEIWRLCNLRWTHDTPEGKKILEEFADDLKSLQAAIDDPPMIKYDMVGEKTRKSGKTNTTLN